ncbi:hypothetical protein VQH23_21050 [Pararoseomonas sp. SCSIO 73927]|uniref:head-tail joining protein n=1 Tax=Pararoseomonas sp. SCSIO 73927 TaxID=3114537 RepID=UPI0030D54691
MPVDLDGLMTGALLSAFGQPITYQPRDQPELPPGLRGILDRTQLQVMMEGAIAPSSVAKTWLGVRQADFPPGFAFRPKDRVVVGGLTFDIRDDLPDGQGWVYLELGLIG